MFRHGKRLRDKAIAIHDRAVGRALAAKVRLWSAAKKEDGDLREILIIAVAVIFLGLIVLFGRDVWNFIKAEFERIKSNAQG